jgi:glycosyltransferase involved in cell wall biosynthesis
MSEQPKVSICIPSYNHAPFLPATIESALGQTYKHLEIIITDDGSTDESLQIAQAYAARHPDLIRVFTHPNHSNRGISATVNFNLEQATGAYWSGLASDDLLHPHKIAEQVAFLERHQECGWVYCYAHYIDEHDRRRPEFGLFGTDITRAPEPVERLIQDNTISGMTVLARRAAMVQTGPHDEALTYSDWDFWVRLAAGYRVAFMPHARVRYRVHSYNTSVGIKAELNMRRSLDVMLKLRRQADRIGGALTRPRTKALLELQLAFYSYGVGAEAQAGQYLAAAFVTDPTLQQDARYFIDWLKSRYRILLLMPEQLPQIDFGQWALAHLPAGLAARFTRAVTRSVAGRAFGTQAGNYYRALAHLEHRRKIFGSLLGDARVWREPDLLALHVEALAGSSVSRQLHRLPWFRAADR